MNKYVLFLCVALGLLFFSSCSFPKVTMYNPDNNFVENEKTIEKIVNYINIKDSDGIRLLFSETALDEANGMDEGISYLFSIVGEIKKYERIGGSVDKSNDYGVKEEKHRYRYYLYTENETYLISVFEVTKDDINSKNIGIYSIKLYNLNDETPSFTEAGIYFPK